MPQATVVSGQAVLRQARTPPRKQCTYGPTMGGTPTRSTCGGTLTLGERGGAAAGSVRAHSVAQAAQGR